MERVTPEYAQYIEEEPQITSTAGQPQSLYMKMVDSTNWKLVGETVGIVALVAFVAVVLYWGIKQ